MNTSPEQVVNSGNADGSPTPVKVVRVLVILQIVISVLFIGLLIFLVDYQTTSPFWEGFREGLTGVGYEYTYEHAGSLSATPLLVAVFSIFVLIGLKKRTRRWAIAAYLLIGAEIVLGLASTSVPLIAILNLVLLMQGKSKVYLNFGDGSKPTSSTPGTTA